MKRISMKGVRRMTDTVYIAPSGSVSMGTYDAHRRFLVAFTLDRLTVSVVRLDDGKYMVKGNLPECYPASSVFDTVRDCVDAITSMTNDILWSDDDAGRPVFRQDICTVCAQPYWDCDAVLHSLDV